MRNGFDEFVAGDAIVERALHVERHFIDPVARNQAGDGDEAAVPRRQAGALPNVAEQHLVGVSAKRGSDIGEWAF